MNNPPMDSTDAARAPMVTAIIIFLNGEKYIGEAIESVLAQTLTDWELILVDDGSTDAATAIAQRYAAAHPGKIRYTEHPGHENRGMSASRNAGLRLARGEYVAFLDADDIWLPKRLAIHVRIMEEMPELGVVVGPTLLWRSWSGAGRDEETDLETPTWRPLEPPAFLMRMLETDGRTVPGICSLLVRRADIVALGGFDDSFRTLYEDQVFFTKIFLKHRVMVIDTVLDRYRQHPESACHAAGGAKGDNAVRPRFLFWMRDYFAELGVDDPLLLAALEKRLDRYTHPIRFMLRRLPRRVRRFAFRRLPSRVRGKLQHLQNLWLRWWEQRAMKVAAASKTDEERAADAEASRRRRRLTEAEC